VLVEPVSSYSVIKVEKFDANYRDVQMGEVQEVCIAWRAVCSQELPYWRDPL
jgi:aminoglycoside N3'-acetyltransferase